MNKHNQIASTSSNLPEAVNSFLNNLPSDRKHEYQELLAKGQMTAFLDALNKDNQSKIAFNDLFNALQSVEGFNATDGIITIEQEVKTGSGNIKAKVKRGDKKFIVQILMIMAFILLLIILILRT